MLIHVLQSGCGCKPGSIAEAFYNHPVENGAATLVLFFVVCLLLKAAFYYGPRVLGIGAALANQTQFGNEQSADANRQDAPAKQTKAVAANNGSGWRGLHAEKAAVGGAVTEWLNSGEPEPVTKTTGGNWREDYD